jgi:hypothetical protein
MPTLCCSIKHYYYFKNVPDYLLAHDSAYNNFKEQTIGSWFMAWGELHYWDKNGDEIVVKGEEDHCDKHGEEWELCEEENNDK